jgi:carboxymethylenebutenolidase
VSAPFYSGRIDLHRSCPVVAGYGGRDITTRGYPELLEARLEAMGVPHDVVTYPGAGHSFFTRTSGVAGSLAARSPLHAGYHAPSAEDAHRRIVAFFREHLG